MLRPYPLILVLIAAVTAGCASTATTPPPPLQEPQPVGTVQADQPATTTTCATSAILVNTCRPWTGPDIRWVDVGEGVFPHVAGDDPHLLINWRPASRWADVTPARIDEAALAIRAIAPKKVFLSLHAAPEPDVTGADGCDDGPGTAGTTTEFRRLWKLARERFDALDATNVVWVLGYANDPEWDCLVPELYPGDRYVDWIMFAGPDASRFSRLLMGMNGPDRQVLTKPWAVYGEASGALPNVRAYLAGPG